MSDLEEKDSNNEERLNAIDTKTDFKYKETILTSDQSKGESNESTSALVDVDNDLVLPRKKRTESVIRIEHSTFTDIDSVGLQVWNGAILLAEFILSRNHVFENKCVLEIGSGTGITGIVASKYCASITCTDLDSGIILKTIEQNFRNNQEYVRADFCILPFDFSKEWNTNIETVINKTDIILASELIYDNEISTNLVRTFIKMLKNRPNILIYFSVEKRYVFTSLNLKTEAKHYEYFFDLLKRSLQDATPQHQVNRITDIPQYFYEYERCNETELWYISNKNT